MVKQLTEGEEKSEELVDYESEDYVETATCGNRSSFSVLISGGKETAPGDWPWMALLIYSQDNRTTGELCAGNSHTQHNYIFIGMIKEIFLQAL